MKTKFGKFWDWLAYQEQDEECPVSKNQPVGANCWGDESNVILWRLHNVILNPSKVGLDCQWSAGSRLWDKRGWNGVSHPER